MTDRGVSTALGYVLGLAILTAMITGLFVTTGEVVENQREQAIRSELRVLGNQVAADITSVDRLALAEPGSEVRLTRSLPETVAGSSYQIDLVYDGSRPAEIELVSRNPEVSVTVRVMNGTPVLNSTETDGDVVVRYDGSTVSMGTRTDGALALVKDAGEEPRTSGSDILEFRVENTRDEQVTVVGFEVDATDIDSGMTINDANADEVEIRRVSQVGAANRDGSPDSFDADGTHYEFVGDSNNGGSEAIIDADTDDAEVDLRRFSTNIGTLEIVDSKADADLVVILELSDGSESEFYFRQTP